MQCFETCMMRWIWRMREQNIICQGWDDPPYLPQHGINSIVCLHRFDLPTFSGNALEWQPFWVGFNAEVSSNPSISDVQKLNYLRSQLRGEASPVIAGFSLTSANYNHSVVLVKDHCGQLQKLITAHKQALLDLPNPWNTLLSLQSFYDGIERLMRSLSMLGFLWRHASSHHLKQTTSKSSKD